MSAAQTERFDAVVIGSGFGGSIAALRLAQAGRSVLVLERGKRYPPGEFPRDVRDVTSLFWQYPARPNYQGLYDVRFFSGVGAVVASGVGGGSLIYANIHIRPDEDVFDDPRWPRSLDRRRLDPYYDRVASMLRVAPLPSGLTIPKRDRYREAARQIGRPVFDPDEAVSWERAELPGGGFCHLEAECEFGCQFGAKNTLDLTYLASAEGLGAEVRSGCLAETIEPMDSHYRVTYRQVASGTRREAVARRVVVAAGTLGTTELLLRNRDQYRTLPRLSRAMGRGYSANGDFLGSIVGSATPLDPWRGPDVTSVIRYDEAPKFTMAAPTFNRSVMAVLTSLGQGNGGILRPPAHLLWPWLDRIVPWLFARGAFSRPIRLPWHEISDPARTTFLFAIGRDTARGVMSLKRGKLEIDWDYLADNMHLVNRMQAAMAELAAVYGGTFAPIPTWNLWRRPFTVHSLGGCHLSESPDMGVVSPRGEVHHYPGLFVADGSVIPTSIGFHPAMTIAAVAEYIAEAVIASYEPAQDSPSLE